MKNKKTGSPKTTAKLIVTTSIAFTLAIPAFFRFRDVTEFIIGITISNRWRMLQL